MNFNQRFNLRGEKNMSLIWCLLMARFHFVARDWSPPPPEKQLKQVDTLAICMSSIRTGELLIELTINSTRMERAKLSMHYFHLFLQLNMQIIFPNGKSASGLRLRLPLHPLDGATANLAIYKNKKWLL